MLYAPGSMEAYSGMCATGDSTTRYATTDEDTGETPPDSLTYPVLGGEDLLPDPRDIPQEARRELLRVLASRGKVRPRDLGVSRAYFYQMRRGLRPVPDRVLEKLLELASDDELALVPFFAPYVDYQRIRGYDVDRMVRLIVEWARANPASAKVLLDSLSAELERLGLVGKAVRVTEAHVREFESYLRARVASGDMDPETARDRLRYLRLALDELGYTLTKQGLRSLIRRLQAEQPGVADHTYKALRLFVKEIIQDRELLESIPYPRIKWPEPEAPSWEDICRVADALPYASPPRVFLLLLASTGLRVETVYDLRVDNVRVGARLIWVWRLRHSKRAYFSFVTEKVARELRDYLRYREEYLSLLGRRSERLLPFKPKSLRKAVYSAMDEVLGYRFPLKQVRKRFAEHMSHYLSQLDLAVLMGHAPREVVEKHYLLADERGEMLAKYDQAMSKIPCLGGD